MSTTIASISCGQPGCDRSFGSDTARESHLRYQHQLGVVDPLGYPCRVSTCTASFGTALNRDEHMRDAHRSPAPHADELQKQAQRLGVSLPGSAGTVLTTPAAPVADEVDTSDDLSEDAGSSPAPRSSQDVPSATLGGGGGHEAMATMFVCGEPGCDAEPFKTAQAVGAHRFRAHGIRTKAKPAKPPARRGRPRKAPTARVQSNGHRRGDPAANLVVLKLDRLELEGLVELVAGSVPDKVDVRDPEQLRREIGRLQLLATLQEASSA